MQESPNPNLYISYSGKDKELVARLAGDLENNSIHLEYIINDITSKVDIWKNEMFDVMRGSDCNLFIITPNSENSQYIVEVINELLKESKPLITLIYGDIEIPQLLNTEGVILWRENIDNYDEIIEDITKTTYSSIQKEFVKNNFEKSESIPQQKAPTKKTAKQNNSTKPVSKAISPNHWLFRMNPETWYFEKMKVGEKTFFSTYFSGTKRPEYEMFKEIQTGDQVMAFATESYQSIVCIMEVIAPVGPDEAQGESFKMVVKQLLKPTIPLENIQDIIPEICPKFALNERPPELFFRLSEVQYNAILAAKSKPDVIPDTPTEKEYQPFYLTEGDHHNTTDQLDFENDINSFATVIALKKVNPPLAIGLFGNWGSGKSFFMEKLSERIEELATLQEEEYIGNVVQVKFNSWHYSDANLWASLITQIFESLHDFATKKEYGVEAINEIYQNLGLTSQQLEEAQQRIITNEKQVEVLEKQKNELDKIIKEKEKTLSIWTAGNLVEVVLTDPFIKQDFEDIKKEFEVDKLINNIDQIDNKIAEIATVKGKLSESIALLKQNHKGNWVLVFILSVIFAIAGWLIMNPLKETFSNIVVGGIIATSIFLGKITDLIIQLTPYFNKISKFYDRLIRLKKTIDDEKDKVRLKEHDMVINLNQTITDLTTQRNALEVEQSQIVDKKVKLENEIKEIGSGKLLSGFLASKSEDDAYLKQLGIISWIRRDFSKLNDLFNKQIAVRGKDKSLPLEVKIDRIVLYIDDLDRCNEDVVVKVLEAIHLLLAFPLFVVIVGVDPRWLNNALSEKYKTLFGYINEQNDKNIAADLTNLQKLEEQNSVFEGVATSYDYLEKIFQIPFALKPINKTGREKLLQYLVKDEMEKAKDIHPLPENVPVPPKIDTPQPISVPSDLPLDKGKGKDAPTPKSTAEEQKIIAKKIKERMVFSATELAYMQEISVLFGQTPRTINRYVNIYRIIKTHGNLKVSGAFAEEEFKPIMLTLAIIVGCSAHAEEFIAEISKAKDNESFHAFINKAKLPEQLKTSITPFFPNIETMAMIDFKRNIELISRFSFRTLLK